jgi:uncharacterized protein (DUF1501 family)
MKCSRRDFLKGLSACMAGGFFGRGGLTKLPGTNVTYSVAPRGTTTSNIVVFVQMFGGNDGINMVYPLDGKQRTNYEQFRPTLALPNSAADLTPWSAANLGGTAILDVGANLDGSTYAFNPAMGALHDLYTAGKVAVLPGVHYPAPNHSHFDSTTVYTSADPSGNSGSGWFGKYLDISGYQVTDIPSVIMGYEQSPLFTPCTPGIYTFDYLDSLVFPAYDDATLRAAAFAQFCQQTLVRDATSYPELARIAQTARSTVTNLTNYYNPDSGGKNLPARVQALLVDASGSYSRDNPLIYDSTLNVPTNPKIKGNDLATDLKHVAAVIRANVGARFFHVNINGFDTHSNQEKNLNHSTLLNQLSEAIAAFYNEMDQAIALPSGLSGYMTGSLSSDVAMVTFSEFGRTIRQNGTDATTAGTDHAASSPQFVIGGAVKGGAQYGAYPQFDDPGFEAEDDLKMTTDFRDIFGTILDKWLGVPVANIGPAAGAILLPTTVPDGDGRDYTTYTPLGFL